MKKTIAILIFIGLMLNSQPIFAQNNNNAANVAGAVIAGVAAGLIIAATVENVKEGMERNIVEWIYENKDMATPMQFELKLIKWEATKKEDLSNVSVIGYKFSENNKPPVILLNACSPGWVSEQGINFQYVKVYEITQDYWSKIMLTYLNMIRSEQTEKVSDIDNIPVLDRKGVKTTIPFYHLKSITTSQATFVNEDNNEFRFLFKSLGNGDVHIGSNFNHEFKVDFNEGHLNLFLKSTGDLIRIKRDFLVDITKNVFENKIPVTFR